MRLCTSLACCRNAPTKVGVRAVASCRSRPFHSTTSTSEETKKKPGFKLDLTPSTSSLSVPPSKPIQPVPSSPLPQASALSQHQNAPSDLLPEFEGLEDLPIALRPSRVPSSRIGRLFHYGSLAASMALSSGTESISRSIGQSSQTGSLMMSEGNVKRLVEKLSVMRGAALKLGQFMSIQDSGVLPEQVERILRQVQNQGNYMPNWQLEQTMVKELGPEWKSKFNSFQPIPIAAASIGQVHSATLPPALQKSTGISKVAVKVQFPGVLTSIDSDLSNLKLLLTTSALLPRGLYLENTLKVMKRELEDECDYVREAEAARRFGALLGTEAGKGTFRVPKVIDEVTTGGVLTMEMMDGKPLTRAGTYSQQLRNEIGSQIMRLCMIELFKFRLMQTDPNWSNFLYNTSTRQIELIDFGATRTYSKTFMDDWFRLLSAAISDDKEAMTRWSLKLGYLTGDENQEMIDAHTKSMSLLGAPFRPSAPRPYPFASQTLTESIRALIPVMLRHRLTPPPNETYSLNRKLSGAFLLCARLGSEVDCVGIWEEIVDGYVFGKTVTPDIEL